ncbi:DUF192 domain-containing protein [Pseudomonas syringae group genomosp. 3]|uniref:DUF192 domain-containing protein n=1 Tax=Pseudomonas syringae group genomosp. 3 TaxID=251701 RepID=UPI0006B9F63E|nr:DUF192 domain-containing protein [Pseudomonas syringae group genomosp. 3]
MHGKWLAAAAVGCFFTAAAMTVHMREKADESSRPHTQCTLRFETVTLEDVPQVTELAQMQRGLSERDDISSGMLFTWNDDLLRVFWMKDTKMPLSVAFIDSAGIVTQIEDMEPETEDLHWSSSEVREGLELRQGDFEKLGIKPGSRLIDRKCSMINQP